MAPRRLDDVGGGVEFALADRAFSRVAGARLIVGNSIRLLRDASENYPAWEAAIEAARRSILFESYIIHDDDIGRRFATLLARKAREGVSVRVLYDWVGALGASSRGLWRMLRDAGVEVRCFNPPSLDSPLGWVGRDHRKMIAVDSEVAFVTGLCVGRRWVGWPERGVEPWRDTGVELRGPAVAETVRAFAQTWGAAGAPLPVDEIPDESAIALAGETAVRVLASVPNTGGLYRLDQLIAAAARDTLWLTDAYFVGTTSYVQALRSAALDGVDVRLLLPRASDVPLVGSLSRSGYRPLLESGVRVFEWNGPMLHAKTAVADGRWARVGSTNLNLASWIGNHELDVVVEDDAFAEEMEDMYLDDLDRSTEILLGARNRIKTAKARPRMRKRAIGRGSAGRAAAGAVGIGNAVGAAMRNSRQLGPAEARIMTNAALTLFVFAVVAWFWPAVVAVPLAVFAFWMALSLLLGAYRLVRDARRARRERESLEAVAANAAASAAKPASAPQKSV